jgi:hypothetical protein
VDRRRPSTVAIPCPRRRFAGLLVALLVALLMASSPSAWASEEETTEARLLVLQSISLIANGRDADVVAERIDDAIQAPDKEGTDLPKVEQALTLVEGRTTGEQGRADLARARALLVEAIDIRVATGYGTVPEPGQVGEGIAPYATGAETGTTVVLDDMVPAKGLSDRGDLVLVILGAAAAALGVVLSRRWRPHDTTRELRRRSAEVEAPR